MKPQKKPARVSQVVSERLLQLAEHAPLQGRPTYWTNQEYEAAVSHAVDLAWIAKTNDGHRITRQGRQMLGFWSGDARSGRVDRAWPLPMKARQWLRLDPRQQDGLLMVWLFNAYEVYWDGDQRLVGRSQDGEWRRIPPLMAAWGSDVEDRLLQLGVLVRD